MSKRNLVANQRRSLNAFHSRLDSMTAQWSDYDPEMMARLEELADSVRTCIDEMTRLCTDDE
ncbi:hypothetical protein C5E18_24510 (plasmid) [Pectobacterium parmentieri]|uniref:hypothetical protein n=1 Tax=Pectobacterium parmentieri TaxID=1905730 RepID=UPI000F8D14A8|nr:hypothetical protein [Pectobacterium parmentieri]AZS59282.1 hypothetical protein C5E18_24510 [Pectobacterium parmentieri]